jgi:hypothetical protein
VSALDGRPIRESKDLLISVAAQVDGTDGKPPLRAQAVAGTLKLRSVHAGLVLRPVVTGSRTAAAHPAEPRPSRRDGEWHALSLPALPTHWYRIAPR